LSSSSKQLQIIRTSSIKCKVDFDKTQKKSKRHQQTKNERYQPMYPQRNQPTNLHSAVEIIIPKTSITRTNNKGDGGFPCLKPQELLKKPVEEPFTKTENRIEEIQ
jgi:hypothetical protein